MTASKNTDWVNGLRELADWLEAHPAVDLIRPPAAARFRFDLEGQDAAAFAARHGLPVERHEPYQRSRTETVHAAEVSKTFGPIVINARSQTVVQRRTLGQRIKAVFS